MAEMPQMLGGGPAPPPGAPPLMGPPGGTGAAMAPHPMPGATSQALSGVKLGIEALQKALTQVPMGSELHTALLKAVTDISKHVGDAEADPSATMQTLTNLARQKAAQPNQAALSRLMGQPQGAPGMPMPAAA